MGALLSQDIINEILDRSNIVELISSYIPLKRAGRNYKAPCPFHPEKTPSFVVSLDKQIFHCFGCGAGGNALSFIMQYEKVNFREAIETLAQRNGIPLPEPEKNSFQSSNDDLKKNLYTLYKKASEFYNLNLINSSEAKEARGYLQNRGISKEIAQSFTLGYAKDGWDGLLNYLKSQGESLSLIEKSGLVASKESGGYYDRFRNRIVFPISDVKDRVIAFGARVLDESLPKYINSPESPIYSKGKNLFGLSLSKDFIRNANQAIVVEGYLDMIIPFEAGIKNIVASLGTALTSEQIKLIKRYTNNIVMLYDSDLAGELATLRATELLIKEDMDVRIACLPKKEDPDSFVRKSGQEVFLKMIADAKPIFDHKLNYLLSKYETNTITGKNKIRHEILPTIKKFQNHTIRSEYIRIVSEKLRFDEKSLMEDLKNTTEDNYEKENSESVAVHNYKLTEIPITERILVKLMLEEIHIIDKLRVIIDPTDFIEEKLRKIVQFLFDFFAPGKSGIARQEYKPSILMNYLDDDEAINIISELAALEIHDCQNKEKLISDCVKRLKRDKILYRCQELQKEIQAAQSSDNNSHLTKLILEYNTLIKQRAKEPIISSIAV